MNQLIIDNFKLLSKQIQFDIDYSSSPSKKMINMYRLSSINKVIKQLEKFPTKIKSLVDVKNIEGIGKNSLKRIDEILKTNKLSEIKITQDTEKYLKFIDSLQSVINIGRKRAYDLFKNHNITSITQLKERAKELNLPDNIIKGLKYVDTIKENIPRHDIDSFNYTLNQIILSISPELFGVICGSYRREKSTSNDIDVILVHTNLITKKDIDSTQNYLNKLITKLKDNNIIIDSLTDDNVKTKYMGICKLNNILRRIDIRYVPYESYYTSILYFTGSKDFNTKMRNIAQTMNYTLNEYGLYDEQNHKITINSEKDVFDHLNMEYITPDRR